MGYAYYTLPDGREAGYSVQAECDHLDCHEQIDRGLAYLCGENPDGWRDAEAPGCGQYYCGTHENDHSCTNPACGAYEADGQGWCGGLTQGHDLPHRDKFTGEEFAVTEEDVIVDEAA